MRHRRAGLTLVELLIVLVILAVLTTIAVQSTDLVVDQARFDASQRTLQNIEESILGPANQRQLDGSLLIMGFIADMGRPPFAAGNDPLLQLRELWEKPATVEVFGFKQPASDLEVLVPCGWRGPYLRLPPGVGNLRNSWGNPFVLLRADGAIAADGQPIEIIRSLGSDQAVGGTGYALDSDLIVASAALAVNRYAAPVTGQVQLIDTTGMPRSATGPISVVLYAPNPATGGVLSVSLPVTATMSTGVYTFGNPAGYTPSMGARVIRAYEGTPPTQRSRPVNLMVPAGGMSVTLQIQGAAAPPPMME